MKLHAVNLKTNKYFLKTFKLCIIENNTISCMRIYAEMQKSCIIKETLHNILDITITFK